MEDSPEISKLVKKAPRKRKPKNEKGQPIGLMNEKAVSTTEEMTPLSNVGSKEPPKTGTIRRRSKNLEDAPTNAGSKKDVERPKSAKLAKRKRLSGSFDCRKTPSDGIASLGVKESPTQGLAEDPGQADDPFKEITDENLCKLCDTQHSHPCLLLDPIEAVPDSVIDFSSSSKAGESSDGGSSSNLSNLDLSKSFARLSLPNLMDLKEVDSSHGLSVMAKSEIQTRIHFGPLQGEPILERDIPEDFLMKDLWLFHSESGKQIYLSTVNPEKSNWLRYLRPAPSRLERTVSAIIRDDQLFFVTLKPLSPGEELLYWMGDQDLSWTKKRTDKTNCGGCNIRFSHPLYYRLHCSVFHDPQYSLTIRKYHCKVCGLTVLGKENIIKHATEKHEGKGAYQCQFCKKHFLRLNYLDMHRNYGCSANPSRSRPSCNLCGKKFCQPQKLKIHLRRMHSEGQPEAMAEFQCPLCQKVLASNNALQRHKKEVHGLEPMSVSSSSASVSSLTSSPDASARVACDKCGRTFKNKSNLKIHMLTHSGVKPFGCKVESCGHRFTTKQCLQFHYKRSHGFPEEEIPKIEREVPYTMTAYSGIHPSTVKRRGEGHTKFIRSNILKPNRAKQTLSETNDTDVYDFDNDQDEPVAAITSSAKTKSQSPAQARFLKTNATRLIDGPLSPMASERCSLLVVAALTAAEQDMGGPSASDDGLEALDMTNTEALEHDTTNESCDPTTTMLEECKKDELMDPLGPNKPLSHSTESMIEPRSTKADNLEDLDTEGSTCPSQRRDTVHLPPIATAFPPMVKTHTPPTQSDVPVASSSSGPYFSPCTESSTSYNLYPGIDISMGRRHTTTSSQGCQHPTPIFPIRSSHEHYPIGPNMRYASGHGDYLHEHPGPHQDARSSMDLSVNPLDLPRSHLAPFSHENYPALPRFSKEVHDPRYLHSPHDREDVGQGAYPGPHQNYVNHYAPHSNNYPPSSTRLPPMSSYHNPSRFPHSSGSYPYGYF